MYRKYERDAARIKRKKTKRLQFNMTLFKLPKNQHKSMRKLDHDQKALMIKS